MSKNKTIVGVIGGTGLYSLPGIHIVQELEAETPFGQPSSPIVLAELDNVQILFLSRHGRGHHLLPSEINVRANIYALKNLGAQWCISVSAVGSLKAELEPGHLVIPDQLIDRTQGRKNTFFGEGLVAHVAFADPFCPVLSSLLETSARALAPGKVHRGGTYVCMEGPAFSTRAESELHRSWGASLIGMTALPEAKLAREAELSYAILATVTDYDCWKGEGEDVEVSEILKILSENVRLAQSILKDVIPQLVNARPPAHIAEALKNALLTDRALVPETTLKRLSPLLAKYF